MAKLIFLLVLAFVAYVAAHPSPQDLIQSLPGRVKRAPGPNPGPRHLHHKEITTTDRFGNMQYVHEDVIHPDSYDHFYDGFDHSHNYYDHYAHGHHHHHPHHGGHGFLGGVLHFLG